MLFATAMFVGCSNENPTQPTAQVNNVEIKPVDVPGFNVQNFAEVVKKTTDAVSIEKAINGDNNPVNNLDLNKDNNVDFLKVQESANTIQVIDNDVNPAVTVCTLNVTPQGNNQAAVNIQGSPQYCGNNYAYHSNFTFTDFLLLHYLLTPHRYYYPHYGYGYHPSYYRPYRTSTYRTVTTYRTTTSPGSYRTSTGTNSPRSAATTAPRTPARTSISAPTQSQRSFNVTPANTGAPRSSGFGKSSSSHSSGFGGSSRSSGFGGFGGSSRSSGFGSSRSSGGRHK